MRRLPPSRLIKVPVRGLAVVALLGSVGAFALIDMTNFGVSIVERFGYGLVYLGAAIALVVSCRDSRIDRYVWRIFVIWVLLVVVFMLPTTVQRYLYPSYVAGDALSLVLPALLVVSGWNVEGMFSARSNAVLAAFLLAASLLAPIVGADGNRFEPPPVALVAFVSWGIWTAPKTSQKLLLGCVGLLLGYLSLTSGQRTMLLIWIACAGYVGWQLLPDRRWQIMVTIACTILTAALLGSTLRQAAVEAVSGYRVASVVQGERDDSLLARIGEATDVTSMIAVDGTPANWLVGFGHGATYRPATSFLSRNVTAEGRVHNIHIGPLMVFFRYGFLGLLAYIGLWILTLQVLLGRGGHAQGRAVDGAYALAVAAYLTKGLMFNILVDPLFSFCLAGLITVKLRQRGFRQVEASPLKVARHQVATEAS